MKIVSIGTTIYEIGEYVRTPDGVGIIIAFKSNYNNFYYYGQTLYVKHKFGCSSNTANKPIEIKGENVILIDKDEYDFETN